MSSFDRRRMFRWVLGGGASLALGWPRGDARAADVFVEPEGDAWLDALAPRRQKVILDVRSFALDGSPFRRSMALWTTLTTTYGIPTDDVGIAFGAHGTALAYLLKSAFWAQYSVAEKVAVSLRADDAKALRKAGPKAAGIGADGVRDLRAHGIRVLACHNTMARWSREIAAARQESPDAVLRTLSTSLHDGVEQVPAMIAAVVRAQARGLGYVAVE